jgi:serine O-acetyltransferase
MAQGTTGGRRPSFLRTCWLDLAGMAEVKRTPFPSLRGLVDVLLLPGTWAVLVWRVASGLHRLHLRLFSRLLYFVNVVVFGADLAPGADVGPGLVIPHPVGVAFGDVRMGSQTRLMGGVRIGGGGFADPGRDGFPTIGDECWLMDGAKVFGPVAIGDRALLAANALVRDDVPAEAIAAGTPARVIGYRTDIPRAAADVDTVAYTVGAGHDRLSVVASPADEAESGSEREVVA